MPPTLSAPSLPQFRPQRNSKAGYRQSDPSEASAVSYTIKLLKRKDDIIDARDRQIRELTMQLISNCKNCDLVKAANKALIDDEN